ncbi:MAG: NACHT domain-containing protein [Chloroflexi bacterium]|nr:NACHT domain-containing protein [Chloroflexota bacterium]
MDPVATPLLILVLGNLARELITDACKDYLKDKLKSFFGWMEELGEQERLELAYRDAMEQAYGACLEMLLQNIKGYGYADEELKEYQSSIEAFIKDTEVAEELLCFVREPGQEDHPSADVLRSRWKEVGGLDLPSDMLWNAVVVAFRRQATKRLILSDELRDLLNAQNLQQLKDLVEAQGGVKVPVRRDRYSQRMRTKFSPVDLANLMPAFADDPGRMVIRDVFVAQNVRENPPPVTIPKDIAQRLREGERRETGGKADEGIDEHQFDRLHTAYVNQSPKPVLDIIGMDDSRLLVLTGDPGSGKSTLMRYLLTGIIEPPVDRESGEPLPWTLGFKDAFPLLIELRDFYALRRSDECDNFLEYVDYIGKSENWFLGQHAVNGYLEDGPSLVMFDGLDEVFDAGERERIMQEIAGFAQRYPRAHIVVTSRPIGYREQTLRNAGFAHYGLQDLDDEQIETFIRGWFTLTFPHQNQQADQRIERVLGSVSQSKPIQLLAGNPMLLTIMALLAREEELPRERAKFYEKAVEVLCHHWDANRNLELSEDRYLNADDKKGLLRRLAMRMQAGEGGLKGNVIQEDHLEQEIQAFLMDEQWQPNATEARKAARRMIRQLRERNYILCLRGPHIYGFVHRTFLEYLTAAEYVRRFDKQPQQMTIGELVDLFDMHYLDDDWLEVLQLICGQIDEQFVGQIIAHLAASAESEREAGRTSLPVLSLAIWCLSEVRNRSKLESVSDKLLEGVIAIYRGDSHQEITAVLRAASGLGGAWPSGHKFAKVAMDVTEKLTNSGKLYWPQLVAVVCDDRAVIHDFLNSDSSELRWDAIVALAKHWPDETTRDLITAIAIRDVDETPRRAALRELSHYWRDDAVEALLTERAVQESSSKVREAALEELYAGWPSETTMQLISSRCRTEGFAASIVGSEHSAFGQRLFSLVLETYGPYRDPTEPIPRDHIQQAARRAGISPDQIDETVRSLSEHMGWDITQGSGRKRE